MHDVFIHLKALVKKLFNSKIVPFIFFIFFLYNGGQNRAFKDFLASHGISHFISPLHTPEHNGYSEHRHHYIIEIELIFMHHAFAPNKLALCLCYHYLFNQSSTQSQSCI